MDRLGPNGKVSKDRVHLSRWTIFFCWTGPIEIDRSIRPFRLIFNLNTSLFVTFHRCLLLSIVHPCVVKQLHSCVMRCMFWVLKTVFFPRDFRIFFRYSKVVFEDL